MQTQILNLTHGKVNIFESNGDFKSTYEIMKEISEVYSKLTDPEKLSYWKQSPANSVVTKSLLF